jgi:hypothetical protein
MDLRRMSKLKEKLGLKKKEAEHEESREEDLLQEEGEPTCQVEGSGTASESSGSASLTEKLKAAFHEKPKEDPELERRKELDNTIRGFRKSFRHDVSGGVKQIGGHLATGVKTTITTIKEAAKTKRKEKTDEQSGV